MATESSAVVRFINLAQQSQNPVLPTPPAPITSEFGTEVIREVRRKSSRAPLIVGAIVLAGGAATAGIFLGKNGFGGSDSPDKAAAPPAKAAAAAPSLADRDQASPADAAEPAEPAAPAAAEPPATAPVVAPTSDLLAATGFDIRVEPGATITLDGSVLGKAPLRVRNLQSGPHIVDIEAPPGYFSRRLELALAAGEAKDLRISLDAIEEDKPAAVASSGDDRPKAKASSSSSGSRRSRADLRRERKEKAREEAQRKKEMKAARVAAAKAAKKSTVVAEPLKDEPAAKQQPKDEKMEAADAELEAAMAEITGKPVPKRSASSAASAAGASSLAASSEPAAISGKGTLMLGSKPPCDIILDGRPTGLKTPQRAMELSPGTHSVTLVNPELGIEKKFKVKIAPGKTTKAIQDLTGSID